MDDKFIYYLVLGAIYLISRMLKKKKPVKPIVPPSSSYNDTEDFNEYEAPPQVPTQKKPTSFEDLLKEISQEFVDRREEPAMPIVEEPIETITPIDEHIEHTREQEYVEKRQAEMAAEDRIKELKRLEEEEAESQTHTVLELLHEEGGPANAVILSEILNRKY